MSRSYDVIIVGAGAAGCILAARLTADPSRRVLLVEAGPDFAGRADYPPVITDERFIPQEYLWRYEGVRMADDPAPIPVIRGKALGGSTSVNTMIYQRGAPEDYDGWGSPLWSSDSLQPFFAMIEHDLDLGGARRPSGQLPIRRIPISDWPPTARAFYGAAQELGFHVVEDLRHNVSEGVGPTPRNCRDAVRMSTALAYLEPARGRPNLTIMGETLASRVRFDHGHAVGLEIMRAGERTRVDANEVILSAGAIGSPHVLMLSGVGPSDVLERLGIEVIAHRPGVGRNLSDHPAVNVVARLHDGVEDGDARILTTLVYTAQGSSTRNDMFSTVSSGSFSGIQWADQAGAAVEVGIACTLNLADSLGEIEVVSPEVRDLPRIHYRYLESERDRARLRGGVRLAVRMLETSAFAPLIAERSGPSPEELSSDEALDDWVRSRLRTALHGCGTCKMGDPDDGAAVVDHQGRVHGVDGLRVVDLSIAPRIVRSPTNATAMVIAERIASLISQEALPTDEPPVVSTGATGPDR
jgi:choline dehydrogenase-like flavoprotein